jgi:hypothetical protein
LVCFDRIALFADGNLTRVSIYRNRVMPTLADNKTLNRNRNNTAGVRFTHSRQLPAGLFGRYPADSTFRIPKNHRHACDSPQMVLQDRVWNFRSITNFLVGIWLVPSLEPRHFYGRIWTNNRNQRDHCVRIAVLHCSL